ncbi:hypothetical protein [Streptomyces sp. NPDC056165]|uniref:hypothetical protein n=1 Tax=Streptomyces sp. NPDC056165 TaxID=3345733 RepID=UPI0035E2E464
MTESVTTSDLLDARNEFRARRLKELLADREAYERQRRQAAQASYERCIAHEAEAERLRFRDGGESQRFRGLARVDFATVLDPLPREREALEAREAALQAHWDEPAVWTRTTPGAPLKIYHYTTACGHVSGAGRHPDSFHAQFESEAAALRLTPCGVDFCRWAREEFDRLHIRARA